MGESSDDEDWLEDSEDEESSLPLDEIDIFQAFAGALAATQARSCLVCVGEERGACLTSGAQCCSARTRLWSTSGSPDQPNHVPRCCAGDAAGKIPFIDQSCRPHCHAVAACEALPHNARLPLCSCA